MTALKKLKMPKKPKKPRKQRLGNLAAFAILACFATACQILPPTVARDTTVGPHPTEALAAEAPAAFASRIISKDPVILDVRSPLDFGVSHVPGSINTRWEDFRSPAISSNALDPDRFGLARRLALWGIDPEQPVLVLGLGFEGLGEEGRVAWSLRLLGVKDVETATIRLFASQIPREGESRPANKAIWKPKTKERLEISSAEFQNTAFEDPLPRVSSRARAKALQGAPIGRLQGEAKHILLDVRHSNEKGDRSISAMKPRGRLVETSWRNFFDEHGRGNCAGVQILTENQVTADQEILIMDEDGVAAAAVAFVLDSCGFGKPRALSAGLRSMDKASSRR
jgi:thiosulfate/3-mercaptopyruvate sulfurtransferase